MSSNSSSPQAPLAVLNRDEQPVGRGRRLLTVADGQFVLDGEAQQIVSGAVHYFRIHPELWRDRLERVRALGVTAVETYLPWNFHSPRPGEFDFSGPRDVARFIELADDLGLDVLARPGPYICAEWDFGGLPAYLMTEQMALRSTDPRFLAATDQWFDAVVPLLADLQSTRGGPVIAVQVENEYGSHGDDAGYLRYCRDALRGRGINVLLFTSDGAGPDWLANGTLPDVLATANFGSRVAESLAELRAFQPAGPDMVMEYWNGWFDHWGEPHHHRDDTDATEVLAQMLGAGASVNLYMAHGGTNFGLWNGANTDPETGALQPTVTSYDYDAPIGEAGELAGKFHRYRAAIAAHTGRTPPEPPEPLPRQRSDSAVPTAGLALLDALAVFDAPVSAPLPLSMERLGAARGLVHYRGDVMVPPDGRILQLDGLADRATVLVDGVPTAVFGDAGVAAEGIRLDPKPQGRRTVVDIIVENQGRVNFGPRQGEHKGIRAVRLGQRFVHGWQSRAIQLDDAGVMDRLASATWAPLPGADSGATDPSGEPGERGTLGAGRESLAPPRFYRSTLTARAGADGFLALPGWTKGFVWLNGFLLGRYWSIGPQRTLYAPAPLWRDGENDVVVLEMERAGRRIELRSQPDLG